MREIFTAFRPGAALLLWHMETQEWVPLTCCRGEQGARRFRQAGGTHIRGEAVQIRVLGQEVHQPDVPVLAGNEQRLSYEGGTAFSSSETWQQQLNHMFVAVASRPER